MQPLTAMMRAALPVLAWERRGDAFAKGVLCLAFSQMGEDRGHLLCLPFFGCLQLKITLVPKWYIWGGVSKTLQHLTHVSCFLHNTSSMIKQLVEFSVISHFGVGSIASTLNFCLAEFTTRSFSS